MVGNSHNVPFESDALHTAKRGTALGLLIVYYG